MKICSFALVLFLAGCATPYQPDGFAGGFSDTQLDTNVFRIVVNGNGHTSENRVEEMALLRSSELALAHGFSYFVVAASTGTGTASSLQMPTYANTTTTGAGSGVLHSTTTMTGGETYKIFKPGSMTTIICLNQKPPNVFSYNAKFVYDSLSKKYKK